jgi:hypothetical protein
MREVTIELDEHVARWVRARASEQGVPIAQLIGEMLRWKMLDEDGFEASGPSQAAARPIRSEPETRERRVTVKRYSAR